MLKHIRAGKRPIIGVMLFLLFLLQTMAASEALHLDFHEDAGAADHSCAVQHFSNGQVDLAPSAGHLPLPPVEIDFATFHAEIFISAPSHCLLPSRGPPSLA